MPSTASSDNPYIPNVSGAENRNSQATSRRSKYPDDYTYASTLPKYEGDPLENVYKEIKDYDKGMCDAWKDEIEKLLIFAGLFSATVTGFTIESYKWLKEDQTATSAQFLAQISLQLNAIALNNTTGALVVPSSPFTPDPQSVRINIFWFVSLVTSLSAVFFGILCLQWLREFTRERHLSPEEAIPIRQLCYEGLITWKVPQILAFLPVLLQASVLLFFAGIIDLLWTLDRVVAYSITTIVALVALMILCTTLAPLLQVIFYAKPHAICPYKSPLSWFIFWPGELSPKSLSSWSDVDLKFHHKLESNDVEGTKYSIPGFALALKWMMKSLPVRRNPKLALDLFHSFHYTIPKVVLTRILDHWKGPHRISDMERKARDKGIEDKDILDGIKCDTFMLELLRPVKSSANLLLELHLKLLTTLGDRSPDALTPFIKKIAEPHNYDFEIQYRILMASLESALDVNYANLWHNQNRPLLGQALNLCFKGTKITEENIPKCKEILTKFEALLDHLYEYPGDQYIYLESSLMAIRQGVLEKWQRSVAGIPNDDTSSPLISKWTRILERIQLFLKETAGLEHENAIKLAGMQVEEGSQPCWGPICARSWRDLDLAIFGKPVNVGVDDGTPRTKRGWELLGRPRSMLLGDSNVQ